MRPESLACPSATTSSAHSSALCRRISVAIVALSVVLAVVIGSMAAAPTVIRRVYRDNYLRSMRVERAIQRQRLHENVVQMSSLENSLEDHRIRVEKLIAVYGLDR